MIFGTGSTMCICNCRSISLYIWLKFLFQNNGTPAQRTRWRSQQPKVWRHGGQNELFVLLDVFIKTQLCIFFNQTTQSATAWCSVGPFVHSTTLVIITLIKSMANTIYILAWSLNCKIWPPCYQVPIFSQLPTLLGLGTPQWPKVKSRLNDEPPDYVRIRSFTK